MGQGAEFAGLIPEAKLWKKSQVGVLLGMVLSNHTDDHGFMIQLLKRRSEGGLIPKTWKQQKKDTSQTKISFSSIFGLLKKIWHHSSFLYLLVGHEEWNKLWRISKMPYQHNVERLRELLPSSSPRMLAKVPPPKNVRSSWWWPLDRGVTRIPSSILLVRSSCRFYLLRARERPLSGKFNVDIDGSLLGKVLKFQYCFYMFLLYHETTNPFGSKHSEYYSLLNE